MSNPPLTQAQHNALVKQIMQASIDNYAALMPSTNFDKAHARATTVISVHTDHIDTTTASARFTFTIPPKLRQQPHDPPHARRRDRDLLR